MRHRLRCLLALLLALSFTGGAVAQTRQERERRQQPRAQQQRPPAPPPTPPRIVQEPLPPPVLAAPEPPPPPPPPPPPRQRHVSLAELGQPAGAEFGTAGREFRFPLPRGVPGLAAHLALAIDLAAPFPARHAVEVRINGRLLGAQPFPEGGARLILEGELTAEELAREAETLSLHLRLVEQSGPAAATATLAPESHLALLIPDGVLPPVAAMLALMPAEARVLTRPGPLPANEAAAALRIALALAATGRAVRIEAAPAPEIVAMPGGARLWRTGAVVVGATPDAARVVELGGAPALAIGGADPEGAARLLEAPWRALAGLPVLATASAGPPGERGGTLQFGALRGALPAQEGARAEWALDFSTRDLPAATWPSLLSLELNGPAGGHVSASLNGVLLGGGPVPPEGALRLSLAVPPALLALENRIAVLLQRQAAGAPAQLLPSSALRLGPAGPPAAFAELPPAMAAGFELHLEAMTAEALNLPLWLLRGLAPAGAPILISAVAPGSAPRPGGTFVALTREPPVGAAPLLRFDAGAIELSDRGGRNLMRIDAATPLLAAQLLASEGRHGLWLRLPEAPLPFALPAAAPRLDRGDVALLDAGGVALAWSSARPAAVAVAYPEAARPPSAVRAWRPWVAGLLWLGGVGIVAYAFLRPRREWEVPGRPWWRA